ncbi:conserved Plasmodium protein, unknown function [Plasmodium vinckei vinckei]|uniref:Uncharacterized protein n=1 Tax=Plasmodium vinckei vinckei TaxID=54757 RepID=A0A449BZI8_PLAVN|nr:conserved Plasmodium protein, unknown function [Plasmodium vinckei vinckei]KEG04303.1 hypothetical protein YYE_01209 [Plasmodium vinckei vinckei]VEV58897.1 conserved Plasmodium protein, unknown function [Plasmodium vinckei vinckei]
MLGNMIKTRIPYTVILKNQCYNFLSRKQLWYSQYNNLKNRDSLNYLYELYKSIESCKSGHMLYKLSNKALNYQIFDLYIWRLIENKFYELNKELTPKELSSIINHFKQMKINDSKIYENSIDIILASLYNYSIHDLSLICLSYTYFYKVNKNFLNKISSAIINLYEQEKNNIQNLTKSQLNELFISYVHIIGAYSKIQHKNIDLFKAASVYIYEALNLDINVPPKIILKIIDSYSNVKIKHSKIFDLLAKQIPTTKITDDELKNIKRNLDNLKYSNDTLDKYIEYRLS